MDQNESMRILIISKVTDTVYSCNEVTVPATMAWRLHKESKREYILCFKRNAEHQGHGIKEARLSLTDLTDFIVILWNYQINFDF